MPFNLADAKRDGIATISRQFQSFVDGAVTTAIVIVSIIIIIVTLTYDRENGIIKLAFWAILMTVIVIFAHDNIVREHEKVKNNQRETDSFLYKPVATAPPVVIGNKEEKIQLPALSITKQPLV